jgi:hypothetical protein
MGLLSAAQERGHGQAVWEAARLGDLPQQPYLRFVPILFLSHGEVRSSQRRGVAAKAAFWGWGSEQEECHRFQRRKY